METTSLRRQTWWRCSSVVQALWLASSLRLGETYIGTLQSQCMAKTLHPTVMQIRSKARPLAFSSSTSQAESWRARCHRVAGVRRRCILVSSRGHDHVSNDSSSELAQEERLREDDKENPSVHQAQREEVDHGEAQKEEKANSGA